MKRAFLRKNTQKKRLSRSLLLSASVGLLSLSSYAQSVGNGYIYVHKKQLDESLNQNFTFSGSNGIGTFTLNDNAASNIINRISAGSNGKLWVQEANGASPDKILFKNTSTSQWQNSPLNNVKLLQGINNDSAVYISTDNKIYLTNGVNSTEILNLSNPILGTYNQNIVQLGHLTNNNILAIVSNSSNGNSGKVIIYDRSMNTWRNAVNTLDNEHTKVTLIAGNHQSGNRYFYTTNEYPGEIRLYDYENQSIIKTLAKPSSASGNAKSIAPGSIPNFETVHAIYTASGFDHIFTHNNTVWSGPEQYTRNSRGNITTSFDGQLWVNSKPSDPNPNIRSIFVRTGNIDQNGNVIYLDDERVRTSPTTSNTIIIPVTAGTYTIQADAISGWNTTNITVYDPTSNSNTNINNRTATLNVGAGEIVHTVFESQYATPRAASGACGTEFTIDFGSGIPAVGPAQVGLTSYHYHNGSTVPIDGYYAVRKTSTGWGNSNLTNKTGDLDGYFLVVNSSYLPDIFFRQQVTNLTIGEFYTLSFSAADLSPGSAIRPNLTLGIMDVTTKNIIGSTTTGEITNSGNGVWKEYSFVFKATSPSVDLFIRNNARGGSGNDVAIDDIKFNSGKPATPVVTVNPTTCNNNLGSITITAPLDDISNGLDYEYSIDGISYTDNLTFSNLSHNTYNISVRRKNSTCVATTTLNLSNRTICGNVYQDANGMSDNTINGTAFTPPSTLYAVLYNTTTNLVEQKQTISNTGTFSLTANSTSNYNVIITNINATIGATTAPNSILPSRWVTTGKQVGTATGTLTGNLAIPISNLNVQVYIGLQMKSKADTITHTLNTTPAYNTPLLLNGVGNNPPILRGSDPEDQPTKGPLTNKQVVITSIPTNGDLMYNDTKISEVPYIINSYVPELLSYKLLSLSAVQTSFNYAYIDRAGVVGDTGIYTIQWTTPLPVKLLSFAGHVQECNATINWKTEDETNFSHFNILHSTDGQRFKKVESIETNLNGTYSYSQALSHKFNYYKLELIDLDGTQSYSKVVMLQNEKCNLLQPVIYPNPANQYFIVKGLTQNSAHLIIYNAIGKQILSEKIQENSTVDISKLVSGIYHVQIIGTNGEVSKHTITKE